MSTLILKQPVVYAYVPNTVNRLKTGKNECSIDAGKHLAIRSKTLVRNTNVTYVSAVPSITHSLTLQKQEYYIWL